MRILPADGGDCEDVLAQFAKAGVDIDALATKLQDDGAKSFVKSWDELMSVISAKSEATCKGELELDLQKTGRPMNILVIDVGGTHVKILASHEQEKREIESGPTMTAQQMVSSVKELAGDWKYDVVSIGYPGPVVHHRPDRRTAQFGERLDGVRLRRGVQATGEGHQ